MKKILLTLVALVAFTTTISAQKKNWQQRPYNSAYEPINYVNNIKASNSHMTIYLDDCYRRLKQNNKWIEGKVAMGRDKNGELWIANLSDYRLDVQSEWQGKFPKNKLRYRKEILDPWEITRCKDESGNLLNKSEVDKFKITCVFEH